MPTSNPASIEVEGLVREFKKGPRAVDGIDLQVAPGEIYGFLGPNGAGKSTTVLMLTTLLPPTSGTARVAGYDIVSQGAHVRESIGGALPQGAPGARSQRLPPRGPPPRPPPDRPRPPAPAADAARPPKARARPPRRGAA